MKLKLFQRLLNKFQTFSILQLYDDGDEDDQFNQEIIALITSLTVFNYILRNMHIYEGM